VLRVIGARGGFEIGTQIVHMPRLHQRRFRQFIKQLKAGEIAAAPAARRRHPRSATERFKVKDVPELELEDDTLPLIPIQ